MGIIVRPFEPRDWMEIKRIQSAPAVRAQQYRFGGAARNAAANLSTIEVDDRVAGYLMRHYKQRGGWIRVKYGWGLAPEFWGRGIMPAALCLDFTAQFADRRVAVIDADCFHDNPRCIRVLRKLGCRGTFISPLERLELMLAHRCSRWIVRYRMTRESWQANSAATNADVAAALRVP